MPMTDPDPMTTTAAGPRRRPLLLIGTTLWIACLIAIMVGWYQWHARVVAARADVQTAEPSEDLGRTSKQITLVMQQDGSFEARDVKDTGSNNPWDADGIADFSFTDTEGHTVTKQDLLGKPFVISFIFTLCRGPCPNVTKEMRELQDRLKDFDFNLVSLTVDPERDTVDVLQRYGKEQGADFTRWKFLTGDQTSIYRLIQGSFKMPVQELSGEKRIPGFEIIHSTNIMLVDATGRVIGKYNSQKGDEMAQLRKKLKRIAPVKQQ
jgi:protein SCO1/2